MSKGLLFSRSIPITEKISVFVPTIGEILEDEDAYNGALNSIIATPYDLMVQLDNLGIDFETISEYELFLMLFEGLQKSDTHLIFGDLDLSKFHIAEMKNDNSIILYDEYNDIIINKSIHRSVCRELRRINNLKKNSKKPGNAEGKKYMLERARKKQERLARMKNNKSQLEDLIVALINTEQFKYDFKGVKELTIYQFNKCLSQVIKKIDYDNTMIGCYAGTVDINKLNPNDYNWLS